MAEMTPLMRQYWEIKAAHQDKILLFRMGDFFEMFFDDAVRAAPLLGIALTSRNKKSQDETPMCGVPHHSVAGPIQKLLSFGIKVAICDQIEDPKLAKGIVKRAVTRILTPGMVLDPETLETTRSHYIACFESSCLACVDATTGESFFFPNLNETEVARLIDVLPIAEWVHGPDSENLLAPLGVVRSLCESLADADDTELGEGSILTSPRRLLFYIRTLGGSSTNLVLKPFEARSLGGRMGLSGTTLRHLEIFASNGGEIQSSLFAVINKTQTSIGARLFRQWISFPLMDLAEIARRQDQVQHWMQAPGVLKPVRQSLAKMGDLERRLSKTGQPSCSGRDLLSIRDGIRAGVNALELAGKISAELEQLQSLANKIEHTLVDEPPLQIRQGHIIRTGFSAELDEIITLSTNSHALLEQMEQRERAATGISTLKIRYNQVFGYYIEVTHTHKDKIPPHYMRKQTLANAERFCTQELLELEKKVLSAQTRRNDLEYEIFDQLRSEVLQSNIRLLALASQCAELDVLTSLAWLALEKRYVRPQIQKDGDLRLAGSRHPVVETTTTYFVPNDIEILRGGCILLTGPNMAGKSTLMRQVALTVLLAQIGSFVPADAAKLPLFDHIFTRIGANDQLSAGLSTFMVEMTETSEIVKKMTPRSLVILDEIGRGTSTFDGMSLAQAILEYLVGKHQAITLFATHYHELTRLSEQFSNLKNAHMTVSEKAGEIRFLHTLKQGPALKSYGIQVAKLAGLPIEVTGRAQQILKKIETTSLQGPSDQMSLFTASIVQEEPENPLIAEPIVAEMASANNHFSEKLLENIREWPVQKRTPLEALTEIAKWQDMISSQTSSLNS